MSEAGLTVLDGTQLRLLSISLPEPNATVTGAQLLEIADARASQSLFGLSLPPHVKTSALACVAADVDDVTFLRTELSGEQASKVLSDYFSAIADGLKEDPLVVSVLDGNTLRLFLEDEDDFAMLAENLFTDLDTEDKGKICKSEIRNALINMGVEMGIPPLSEFPLIDDILKKHGAEGEEELGQAQFAELLQPVIQEIADELTKKHVVVQSMKMVNGSKLTKLLADEKQINNVIERILQEKGSRKDDVGNVDLIRVFLEKNGEELGLPRAESNEAVVHLYDAVFSEVNTGKGAAQNESQIRELLKDILEKFAEQLETNPILCALDS